jgi:CheY-like chemotaxis protein
MGPADRAMSTRHASGTLAAEIRSAILADIAAMGIGAVLGVRWSMKPVTIATQANLRGKQPTAGPETLGNLSDDADFYARHVLVVDDEPLIRWSVSETLSDLGYDVEQAPDAGSALRTVTTAKRPFDVVVLDLRLPDMDDLSLLATLRQLLPKALLILMTAFGTAEIVNDAQALGATVLNKPFELIDLQRLVSATDTDAI